MVVVWFCMVLKNSKTVRVDSNCQIATCVMNRWADLHVRVSLTLGKHIIIGVTRNSKMGCGLLSGLVSDVFPNIVPGPAALMRGGPVPLQQ